MTKHWILNNNLLKKKLIILDKKYTDIFKIKRKIYLNKVH